MLLEEIKDYLNITWNDVGTDDKIKRHIASGKAFLNEKAGKPLDFDKDAIAYQLLSDYCRYAYNHTLELFQINFEQDLIDLSMREALREIETSQSETPS